MSVIISLVELKERSKVSLCHLKFWYVCNYLALCIIKLQVTFSNSSKSYTLPKPYKNAGKSLARGSHQAFAKECLSDDRIRRQILKVLGRDLRTEIKRLSSKDSILSRSKISDIQMFQWNIFYKELEEKSHTFLSFLQAATETRTPRTNRIAIMCICAGIMLKYRFPHLCLIQKIIGLILYYSQCFKAVSHNTWLQLVLLYYFNIGIFKAVLNRSFCFLQNNK